VLYDYQLRHAQADTVTKVLLRAYPGIQHDLLDINEAFVAKHAKMELEVVVKCLEAAQKANMLTYQAGSDKPQLTFLQPIVAAEHLSLSPERYAWRKQRALDRLESAIRYAETRRCRSQLLLGYFGETASQPCGVCDVCTGRNDTAVTDQLFVTLEKKIRAVLKDEPLTFEDILSAFAAKQHEAVAKVLHYMLEEGMIKEMIGGKLGI
jgi:ATP-dependent DNA helicase RecQ